MNDIYLLVYDLSDGLAIKYSEPLFGLEIKGIWHTSLLVYEKEWYYSLDGIKCCFPMNTSFGLPVKAYYLGYFKLGENEFMRIMHELSRDNFKKTDYDLLKHNCNNFTNYLSLKLVGHGIPEVCLKLLFANLFNHYQ